MPGLKNGIANVTFTWGLKSGDPKGSVPETGMENINAIIAKKWRRLHEGHAEVDTMINREKSLRTGVTMKEMREQLKSCQMCQKNLIKRGVMIHMIKLITC